MSKTELIPQGTYYIVVDEPGQDDVVAERLTRRGESVFLHAPDAVNEIDQVWTVDRGYNGDIIIASPGPFRPSDSFLTYKGAPDLPKEGAQIIYRRAPSPNEWTWRLSGSGFILRAAHSQLGICAGHHIPPGIGLVLGREQQLRWKFIRVHPR